MEPGKVPGKVPGAVPMTVPLPAMDPQTVAGYLAEVPGSITGGVLNPRISQRGDVFWIDREGSVIQWNGDFLREPTTLLPAREPGCAQAGGAEPGHAAGQSVQPESTLCDGLDGVTDASSLDWSLLGLIESGHATNVDGYEQPCRELDASQSWLVLGSGNRRRYLNTRSSHQLSCSQPESGQPKAVRDNFPIASWVLYEEPSPDGQLLASLDGPDLVVRERQGDPGIRYRRSDLGEQFTLSGCPAA